MRRCAALRYSATTMFSPNCSRPRCVLTSTAAESSFSGSPTPPRDEASTMSLFYHDKFEKEGELTLAIRDTLGGLMLSGLTFTLAHNAAECVAIIGGLQASNDTRHSPAHPRYRQVHAWPAPQGARALVPPAAHPALADWLRIRRPSATSMSGGTGGSALNRHQLRRILARKRRPARLPGGSWKLPLEASVAGP